MEPQCPHYHKNNFKKKEPKVNSIIHSFEAKVRTGNHKTLIARITEKKIWRPQEMKEDAVEQTNSAPCSSQTAYCIIQYAF